RRASVRTRGRPASAPRRLQAATPRKRPGLGGTSRRRRSWSTLREVAEESQQRRRVLVLARLVEIPLARQCGGQPRQQAFVPRRAADIDNDETGRRVHAVDADEEAGPAIGVEDAVRVAVGEDDAERVLPQLRRTQLLAAAEDKSRLRPTVSRLRLFQQSQR